MTTTDTPTPAIAVVETEAALLGAMMIDNRVIDQAVARLEAKHFYEPVHAKIFKAMLVLRRAGDAATPITVRPYVANDPGLEQLGGAGYLAMLSGGGGAGLIGAKTFVDQIIQFWEMRELRAAYQAGIERIEAPLLPRDNMTLREYLDQPDLPSVREISVETAAAVQSAVEGRQAYKTVGMGETLRRVRARFERAAAGQSIGAKCRTVEDLNDLITAAGPEQMTIIGGRPGMGKTVLACSAAWGYAINGHGTLIISLEMSEDALAMRNAADLTFGMGEPIEYKAITRNELTESDLLTIDEAERRIAKHPLRCVSPGRVTIEEIDALVALEAAAMERRGEKLEVVIVDYVQIIAATGRLEGTAKINHISEGLLGIAKRYKVHVFALSQLLRDIDKRPDRRPTTADLKESGRLEEDADNVILVFRNEHYLLKERPNRSDSETKWTEWEAEYQACKGRADLIGGKSRMNEPVTRRVKFYGKHQAMRSSTFEEAAGGVFGDEQEVLLPQLKMAA